MRIYINKRARQDEKSIHPERTTLLRHRAHIHTEEILQAVAYREPLRVKGENPRAIATGCCTLRGVSKLGIFGRVILVPRDSTLVASLKLYRANSIARDVSPRERDDEWHL